MMWLQSVGALKFWVSFAKEPYKRDYILQKRPIILRSLLIVATPYDLPGSKTRLSRCTENNAGTPRINREHPPKKKKCY